MPGFDHGERVALYTHLRTLESDFDRSQSQIRAICLAWSAAVLAAIALIAVNALTPPSGLDADAVRLRGEGMAYVRNVVCLLGSAGVIVFWFVDQRIYQRLLHTVFAYGLHVEAANTDLPQLRSSLYLANLDIGDALALFYRLQAWAFLIVSALFSWLPFGLGLGPQPYGIRYLAAAHLFIVLLAEISSRRWSSLIAVIDEFYPDLARQMPQQSATMLEWIGIYRGRPIDAQENARRRQAWIDRIKARPLAP